MHLPLLEMVIRALGNEAESSTKLSAMQPDAVNASASPVLVIGEIEDRSIDRHLNRAVRPQRQIGLRAPEN